MQIIEFLCQKSRLTNFPLKLNFWAKNGGLEKCDTMGKNHKKKILDFWDIFCPLCFDAMHCNSAQQNKGKLVSDDSESRFKRPFAKVFA